MKNDHVSAYDVARQCLAQAHGDLERAMRLMRERIETDEALRATILGEHLDSIARFYLDAELHNRRRACARAAAAAPPPLAPKPDNPAGIVALSQRMERDILRDYWLDGMPIGEHTRESLLEGVGTERERSRAYLRRARLRELIAAKLKPKQKVRDGLSAREVERLLLQANARIERLANDELTDGEKA